MKVDEMYGNNDLAKHVIKSKYLQPNEDDVNEMWDRVAKAAASVESKNRDKVEKKFRELLEDFKMVPGGRILAGAGIEDKISLTNCISGDSILITEIGKIRLTDISSKVNLPKILTYDFERGVNIFEQPDSITLTKKAYPLILMFKDQRYIKCTEDHKFYVVNKGWLAAQDIEIGDCIYSENRTPCDAKLENKIKSEIEEDVYDISMPVNHWFYANELLVHNCYASDIDDCIWEGEDKPSIYRTLLNHALTFKASGGTSANLSSLRPKGTPINNNVNQESCGPVGFMELFSVNTATISAGRNRRGALLLGLRVDHPDILEFINVKSDDDLKKVLSKIPEKDRQECWKLLNNYRSVSNANISVMITDEFMQAVQEDKEFSLRWAAGEEYLIDGIGNEYKKIKAKELWDIIMKSNYDNAEPGILFYDTIKRNFSTQYVSPFVNTNPCLTKDSIITTDQGPKTLESLIGNKFNTYINCRLNDQDNGYYSSTDDGFFATGHKPVYLLKTKEGHTLKITDNHLIRIVDKNKNTYKDVEAKNLNIGDLIVLSNNGELKWGGDGTFEQGWLLGSVVGDGYFHDESKTAKLQYWGTNKDIMLKKTLEFVKIVDPSERYSKIRTGGDVKNRNSCCTGSRKLWQLSEKFGISHNKEISDTILLTSSEFQKGFLMGIFDADGTVIGSREKGVSIRLSSSTPQHLEYCQKMLLNLGINSKIYYNRRKARERMLPDGKGGKKLYKCKAQHELVISKENIYTYARKVGFNEPKKDLSLKYLTSTYKNGFYKENFVAKFESLTYLSDEDVYDCTIPDIHHFVANGFVVHNCGEQSLSAHSNCNLASLNVSKYVKDEKIDYESLKKDIQVAIRFLDNIIDYNVNRHPLKEQKEQAIELRRCGLGFMGLADLFILMKIKYGSEESIELTDKISKFFAEESWRASIELAKEKGSFPAFEYEGFSKCEIFQKMPEDIKKDVKKYGIRNSAVNSIQPTGSTSIIAQCSSGLEPIFNKGITLRRVRDEHDYEKFNEYKIGHPLLITLFGDAPELPDYVVDAYEVDPFSKIRLQAAIQKYFDGNISNTINLPKDFPQHLLSKIFMLGWQLGLRGVTVYRDGSRMGILEKVS